MLLPCPVGFYPAWAAVTLVNPSTMKSVLVDEEVVDELEEEVEADFQVNEIPLYDNVTFGICAFSSSCNVIVVGKPIEI